MAKTDQLIRKKQWQRVKLMGGRYQNRSDQEYKRQIKNLAEELNIVDRKHTNEIKKIISKFGWPKKSLVGKRVSRATWLLIQHADHDLNFQKKCLKLLKMAVEENEAEKKHLAYLIDRILVHQNKKQTFGTQFQGNRNGKFIPFPIGDAKKVNFRRKKMGLGPLWGIGKRKGGTLG